MNSKKPYLQIRLSMEEHEMKRKDLAKLLGISVQTLRTRMNKQSQWKSSELEIMKKKFGKSYEELLA